TYPVEHMAALTPGINPDDAVTLYSALAAHAGVRRPVTADDPRVACDTLVRDDGATFAVLASHAAETLTLKPVLADGRALTTLDGEEVLEGVTLDPFGIKMFKVTRPRPLMAAPVRPRTVPGRPAVRCRTRAGPAATVMLLGMSSVTWRTDPSRHSQPTGQRKAPPMPWARIKTYCSGNGSNASSALSSPTAATPESCVPTPRATTSCSLSRRPRPTLPRKHGLAGSRYFWTASPLAQRAEDTVTPPPLSVTESPRRDHRPPMPMTAWILMSWVWRQHRAHPHRPGRAQRSSRDVRSLR
ncbi:MAG: hypothetical protein ACRDP5_05520, partial [Streptosporangiaceae bacterium]